MNLLFSWLKEFVETDTSPYEIADRLTMAGIETSSVKYLGDGFDMIMAARINAIDRHPKADRLSVCVVTDGKRDHQIVCGARNIKVGDIVPLAIPGARLPVGIEIKKTKIRGHHSEGMLCSEKELGISDDHEGILIFPGNLAPGTPIVDALNLDDYLMELDITPNRGDCLSVYGIAREVSAIFGVPIKKPEISFTEGDKDIGEEVSITIEDYDLCPRYSSRAIYDIEIGHSPLWLQRRLQLCGIRPINNIVDITNYLLLELGQPMHAFDLDFLEGKRIIVKRAGEVKKFTTLDGNERGITEETLLIWDGKKPVAVAGIMGGENSEVTKDTKRVLFESAHFNPLSIRKSRKMLGISTESSYRFERGVDPSGTLFAVDRAITLLSDFESFNVCKGQIDAKKDISPYSPVRFRVNKASQVIGLKIGKKESIAIFDKLGFKITKDNRNEILVSVPSYRFDVNREIDLIEEIARIKGYDKVPTTYPKADSPHPSKDHDFIDYRKLLATYLSTLGVMESVNYSFMSDSLYEKLSLYSDDFSEEPVRLENPISEDTRVMRPSLLPGLLKSINTNISRYNRDVRLFEIGKVFKKSLENKLFEENRIGVALTGSLNPESFIDGDREIDFYFTKSILDRLLLCLGFAGVHLVPEKYPGILHPRKSGTIKYNNETIGYIGEVNVIVCELFNINQEVFYFELNLDHIFREKTPEKKYKQITKFPPVERDISFLIDHPIPVGDIIEYVRRVDDSLVRNVSVFDLYRSEKLGSGKKSVGIRLVYQSHNRTLTEREVNDIHKKIIKLIENRFGGKVRSS